MTDVLRYAAFTTDPTAGNPAGVVLDAAGLSDEAMRSIAAEVGYSETAFLVPQAPDPDGDGDGDGDGDDPSYAVRYFSPEIEVPFCGHATIATAVAIAEREGTGTLAFATKAGRILVETAHDADGRPTATLTSVATRVAPVADDDLDEALAALRWSPGDLDAGLPPRVAYAGAHHLVLATATRSRLADLDYVFDALRDLMLRRDWTTVTLVWRASELVFHVRNPFPVGGVVEDPATGAAAAALGGYLRSLDLVTTPATLRLHQGEDMGRPGLLVVDVPADADHVLVTGNAVVLLVP